MVCAILKAVPASTKAKMKTIFLNMSVKININKVIHNKSKIINITVIKNVEYSIYYNDLIFHSFPKFGSTYHHHKFTMCQ